MNGKYRLMNFNNKNTLKCNTNDNAHITLFIFVKIDLCISNL